MDFDAAQMYGGTFWKQKCDEGSSVLQPATGPT